MLRNLFITTLIVFSTGNIQAQNVGIGTTTPEKPLTIKTDGMGVSQESTDGTAKVGFYTNSNSAFIQTHSATDLDFSTNNGTAQMTLQKVTGNVGIGTTTPGAKLDVNGRLQTSEGANLGGDVDVLGNLQTQGSVSTDASLFVSDNATINGTLKIAGGSPGVNKVLTSDINGLASWKTPVTGGIILPYVASFSTAQTLFNISNDQGNGFATYTPNNIGVFSVTSGGTALKGNANSGTGVSAYSGTGTAGIFESTSGLAIKTVTGDVEINGKIKVIDGTQSNGAVLTSNSTGTATWAKSSGFTTTKIGGNQNITFTNPISYTKIIFSPDETQIFGTNGYSTTNSDFTAPVTGFYHFDAMVNFDGTTNGSNTSSNILDLCLYKRSASFPSGAAIYSHNFYYTNPMPCQGISVTVYLLANDIIDVRALNTTGLVIRVPGVTAGTSATTFFSGYLVH